MAGELAILIGMDRHPDLIRCDDIEVPGNRVLGDHRRLVAIATGSMLVADLGIDASEAGQTGDVETQSGPIADNVDYFMYIIEWA